MAVNFDRLAPFYDAIEVVCGSGLLQRVRTTWLEALRGRRRVLIAGVGHGKFAGALAQRFPECEVVCVDASERMLEVARTRVARMNAEARVRWIHARLPEWKPDPRAFDAIVTCFFLDCFTPEALGGIVRTLGDGASGDALWLNTDFNVPERGISRWRAQMIHAVMYRFFRVAAGLEVRRLTPPDDALSANGFSLAQRRTFDWGLLCADLWQRGAGQVLVRST